MAKWVVLQRGDITKTDVVYANLFTGTSELLGTIPRDTPDSMLIRWVIDTEKTRPGDVIQFANGRQICILGQVGAA